jgi:glyoxalase family protein
MNNGTRGIHHITAIASDPQTNLDFYTGVLGLRLVKLTVNFDDPTTYHFYFGNSTGQPGTILTFFPWSGAGRGRLGTGQVAATSFSIPEGATGFWHERLKHYNVTVSEAKQRFDEEALEFIDPDGLRLELVAHANAESHAPWDAGPISTKYAIRGFHNTTLWEKKHEPTAELLSDTLGFRLKAQAGQRFRFTTSSDGPGSIVDVIHQPHEGLGWNGAGTVHHVAWRAENDKDQSAWRMLVSDRGLRVTPVMDRQYFRSIYFREPGGVLFEIATDPPGFTVDESIQELGQQLKLPPQLESRRAEIRQTLPKLSLARVSVS